MVTIICTPDWKRVGLSAEKWSPMSHKHSGGPEYTCASYAKLKVGLLWAIPVTKTRSDWPVGPQFSAQRLKLMTPAHCTLHTVELQVLISYQFSLMAKATFQNLSYLTLFTNLSKIKTCNSTICNLRYAGIIDFSHWAENWRPTGQSLQVFVTPIAQSKDLEKENQKVNLQTFHAPLLFKTIVVSKKQMMC